jgi:osmotically-inducible protein OsmY
MRTDDELKQDVMDELYWDPSVNDDAITVAVKDSIVTLSGYVNSFMDKINAERIAEKVFGVKGIVQKIEIKLPHSVEHADEEISRAALEVLEWNTSVPNDRIKVKVKNGWVTLTGEVDSRYQRDVAEGAVCCLVGVVGFTNMITVKPSAVPEDLKEKIESAFQRHAALDARRLTVKTNGNKAILEGSVHSYIEKREAEDAAWVAPGICEVENNITVSP